MTNGAFTANSAYAGYLFVDPDMLSQIGIESILLGGYLTLFRAYETEIIAMNTNATIGRAGSVGTVTGAGSYLTLILSTTSQKYAASPPQARISSTQ